MDLLLAKPRKFAWEYGHLYDVETEGARQFREAVQPVWELFVMTLKLMAAPTLMFVLLVLLYSL